MKEYSELEYLLRLRWADFKEENPNQPDVAFDLFQSSIQDGEQNAFSSLLLKLFGGDGY